MRFFSKLLLIHSGQLIQNRENFGELKYAVISQCTVKMKTVVDKARASR
ncbi:MAG: hypothetical protein ACLTAC_21920 [Hungatella sp.]